MLHTYRPYIFNGFLLTLPVIAWNAILAQRLPPFFNQGMEDQGTAAMISIAEQVCRVLFFIITFLMPLQRSSAATLQSRVLYIAGLLLYVASWIPLVWFPGSSWSVSLPGLTAPAWTPLFWMSGIICLGEGFSFGIPYKPWLPWSVLILFLLFHNLHTCLIFYPQLLTR